MAQFGRPSNDQNNPGSYVNQADSGVNIFQALDEVTLDDADYIKSPAAPSSSVYVTKLTTIEDPVSSTGHVLRARYAKDAAAGAQINMTVELRQGYVNEAGQGTLIATRTYTNIGNIFTTDAYVLSGAEADAITNYADLYLRVVATQV